MITALLLLAVQATPADIAAELRVMCSKPSAEARETCEVFRAGRHQGVCESLANTADALDGMGFKDEGDRLRTLYKENLCG